MSRTRLLEAICAALVATAIATALVVTGRTPPSDRLVAAERLYGEGVELASQDEAASVARFSESAEILAQELAVHDTAGTRFNRANALLRSGQLAAAIAEYRAALLRSPGNASIESNLAEARRKVVNAPAPPEDGPVERARAAWGILGERVRLAGTAILLVGGFLALRLRRATTATISLSISILLGATVAIDLAHRSRTTLAVLREPTTLRKGNGDGFDAALAEALPIGTECRIVESRPGWLDIELGGSLRGWVKDTAVIRVE